MSSATAVTGYDLKNGQFRNLILATLASVVGFWAWTIIGPLAKSFYTPNMGLTAGTNSILVAMPILVGSIARIPVGALTDRYGGRVMFTAILGITAPLVLLTGFAGLSGSFAFLLAISFFLGIAGTVFAIGIPFCSQWYDASQKGFATGVFGAGMAGTAVSAFFTPRFVKWFGYFPTHIILAVVVAVTAVLCWVLLRDSPVWSDKTPEPIMPKLKEAFSLLAVWQLCFLYAVVFGAFVAFSNYLPTYLGNVYEFPAIEAGTRAAGFAAAAVIARPIGGVLADKVGPKIVTLTSLVGVIVLAMITAFQPDAEHVYGVVFILMACFIGLGTGGVFGWVGRSVPAKDVGTAGGIISAAGGLGGYFPPLVMGATYNAEHRSYFLGLTLLAITAALSLLLAFFVKNGGKPHHTK